VQQKLVADLAVGTSKKTISKDRLDSYKIDYIPVESQRAFVREHTRKLVTLREALHIEELALRSSMGKILSGQENQSVD
jgi:hypothetical protein